MEHTKIAVLGCGNLGLSLINGLLQNENFNPAGLSVSKRNTSPIAHLAEKGITIFDRNAEAISDARLIIVAVKPYDVATILEEIKTTFNAEKQILVSVASTVTITEIQQILPGATVFRAMPNTAAAIGESLTCISSSTTDKELISETGAFFSLLGETVFIKEELMEAATVLGACGIAYVLRFMRSMVQGGIQIGFDAESASRIVNQVVKGAAELLITGGQHPEQEIDKVTTPKGCTITGLNEMEHHGFSPALIRGISASYQLIEK
ncbi:MAG: pyrroline-5-carboxylate reductase [Crocinitomicaceae bacterium]|jgi:pyrroline-5-carboxylate reductase|nr:pyrroline-5-carboxylate reductase [Crocinitomicaceae bacterium]